jgi:hypothetical protein
MAPSAVLQILKPSVPIAMFCSAAEQYATSRYIDLSPFPNLCEDGLLAFITDFTEVEELYLPAHLRQSG